MLHVAATSPVERRIVLRYHRLGIAVEPGQRDAIL
jgi:hypothetical protein